jgi:Flp pilus assembly protein TadD/SAM-dependent methyltransferase
MQRDGRKGRRAASGGSATIAAGADASQLLPMAVLHHERGNAGAARTLYEQILAAQPEHADALHYLGILCHQCGEAERAETLIRHAIDVKPQVASYHDNLGTVLEHAGRLEEASAAYRAADALEPGDPDRAYNLGLVLQRLGRLHEARQSLHDAVRARPQDLECRFALANVCKQIGEFEPAYAAYRQLLDAQPGHVGALVNLGNLLQDEGRLEESADLYRQAIALVPGESSAHHNLGRVLRRQGRLAQAQHCFEQALRDAPDLIDARLGLARTLEELGRFDRALAAYRAACEAPIVPAEARAGLLRVLRVHAPIRHDAVVARELLAGVDEGRVPAAAVARALGLQLAARSGIAAGPPDTCEQALRLALDLAHEPLLRTLAERCLNVVPAVERWLTLARQGLLLLGAGDDEPTRALLRALALQCIANEYVFTLTDAERAACAELLARVQAWLRDPDGTDAPRDEDLALAACYAPLAELEDAPALLARAAHAPHWLAPVLERSLLWPLAQRGIAASIATLRPIADRASQQVRAQYESNPYPRWFELPPAAGNADQRADDYDQRLSGGEPLDILVAGCGTGQEPLALASRQPGHRIVALDLSRASLAYAMHRARLLGIEGVRFVHADLAHVVALGQRFDLIIASGVLHHMADPLAGWRALVDCLADDGLMKVGLYSRAARASVNVARDRIRSLGLGSDAHAVRALRQQVLDGALPELSSLLDSEDFYSASACRDLLFHPLEHQFDLAQVAAMLDMLGLRFLGFELPHPIIARAFRDANVGARNDLGAWARFEQANPQTFEAMYVLWCGREDAGRGETRA